jgi:hypothetical protein
MSTKDKKWKLAKWAYFFGGLLIVAGIVFVARGIENGLGVIIAGGGLLELGLGTYVAGNVKQKQYVGQYYQPVMDANNPSNEYLQYANSGK